MVSAFAFQAKDDSLILFTCSYSVLVQLVRMLACHARGHEFESRIYCNDSLAQLA